MKLKNKLLPVFGGLTATVAVVTPLATSCSEWVRYTDMLHEYKPGVLPYQEVNFDDWEDIDELYWARFSKNTDIVRDDILWSLSKIICYETGSENTPFKAVWKEVQTYNFDIWIDEVIQDNPETTKENEDESAINFTISWQFKGLLNEAVHQGDKYIDMIDLDVTFKTIDPWRVWFDEGAYTDPIATNKVFDEDWEMCLERPHESEEWPEGTKEGLVCIECNGAYRYSTQEERAGEKWETFTEHSDVRDLDNYIESTSYAYHYVFNWLIKPLAMYAEDAASPGAEYVNYIQFCSHYLWNVDIY